MNRSIEQMNELSRRVSMENDDNALDVLAQSTEQHFPTIPTMAQQSISIQKSVISDFESFKSSCDRSRNKTTVGSSGINNVKYQITPNSRGVYIKTMPFHTNLNSGAMMLRKNQTRDYVKLYN